MQLLESSHACWVNILQVWSTGKRNTHTPKGPHLPCSEGISKLICSPGWSLEIMPWFVVGSLGEWVALAISLSLWLGIVETFAHGLSAMCWPWWWISSLSAYWCLSDTLFSFYLTACPTFLPSLQGKHSWGRYLWTLCFCSLEDCSHMCAK